MSKYFSILKAKTVIKTISHPIAIFSVLQIIWLATLIIWITWYIQNNHEFTRLAKLSGNQYFETTNSLAILIAGCILLTIIFIGIIVLFSYWLRQAIQTKRQLQFLSTVTHELKSPLAGILLSCETILKRNTLNPKIRNKLLEMSINDVERLNRLVEQILVTVRLNRKLGLLKSDEIKSLNFPLFINNLLHRLKYLDENIKKRVQIINDNVADILISEDALTWIFTNLLENAIKYSPKDKAIKIFATRNTKKITFAVEDSGLGVMKKDLSKIFKIFYRSKEVTQQTISGTGLGLFVVNSAVENLRGKVWVESKGKGKGATFYVSIPETRGKEI